MLLDGFGDSEHIAEGGGNSELLFRLLHAGSNFHSLDPTDTTRYMTVHCLCFHHDSYIVCVHS
jgi:hypothetical protein